jgi:hypothetical protein
MLGLKNEEFHMRMKWMLIGALIPIFLWAMTKFVVAVIDARQDISSIKSLVGVHHCTQMKILGELPADVNCYKGLE